MEIIVENSFDFEEFCDVAVGQIFSYDNHVYIKVNCPSGQNCVCLSSGEMGYIDEHVSVIMPVEEPTLNIVF